VKNPPYILIIIGVILLAVGALLSYNMDIITVGAWSLLLGVVFQVMWLVYRS
jgi:ABC-type Mn2+/Zn2+ transport system permease subunit